MFHCLRQRDEPFIDATASLHQSGKIPANSCVLDLDAVTRIAPRIAKEASQIGPGVLAMTKQGGRNPDLTDALQAGGITFCVAVDTECARANSAAALKLGHVGHLVQVPTGEAAYAGSPEPGNSTVFSRDKAREGGKAALSHGRTQDLLLRVDRDGATFYPGYEGGFPLDDLNAQLKALKGISGVGVAGATTFPALDATRVTVPDVIDTSRVSVGQPVVLAEPQAREPRCFSTT